MAGVTADGFVKKTIEDVRSDIETDLLANLDPALNTAPDQPVGQVTAAFGKKTAEVWELAETVYNAFDPDAAEGRLLDNLCAITGTSRKGEKKSVCKACTVNLGAGFSAAPGTMIANVVGQETVRFTNKSAVTSTTAGDYPADFEAVDAGPVAANAGTLTVITVPVAGWNSITNPTDAIKGAFVESDTALRERRADEVASPGSSTVDAIRVDLLQVEGVQQAFVFENPLFSTDADGLPPKSFEAVIYDGITPAANDVAIAQTIWDSKPAGAETYGTTTAEATDSAGDPRLVKFSRASIVSIYVEVDVTTDPRSFPTNGVALVKDAIVARGNKLNLGDDVIVLAIGASALTVPGVIDAVVRVGLTASPTGTANLAIGGRAIASFDTSRVGVTVL